MEDDNIFIFLLCSGPQSFDKCYLAGWQDGGKSYFSVGQALCKPECICSSLGTFLFCPHPPPLQCPSAAPYCVPQALHHTITVCPGPHLFCYYLSMNMVLPLPHLPAPGWVPFSPAPCKYAWSTPSTQGQQETWDRAEVKMLRPGGPGHNTAPANALVKSTAMCYMGLGAKEDQTHCKTSLPLCQSTVENAYCKHTSPA